MKAPFSQEFLRESKKKSEQESEMETKELFRMKSNYREDMLVQGYRFGKAKKPPALQGPYAEMKSSSSISAPNW